MKRLFSLSMILAALWAAACGGGGTSIAPPPPNNGFSNSNLQGQYAFSMSGSDASTGVVEPFGRIGSFTADGNGNITGGVEDVNLNFVGNGSPRFVFTGGTYSINSDGRGSLSLVNSTGTTTFSISLTSPTSGYIVDLPTDGLSTASGTFAKQNAASFTAAGITGAYAFDLSGEDGTGNPESFLGQITSSGNGTFPSGLLDDNDAGQVNGGNGGGAPISGTYGIDGANSGDLSTFGRGVFTIAGVVSGVFYIVGPNQVKLMETSSGGTLSGDALLQTSPPTTTAGISGGFVYVMGGAGVGGPLTRGGKFATSGGNLTLSSVLVDNNNAGTIVNLNTATTGSYTIDPNGTGRGTLTFKINGQANSFTYVFYLISATQGFVQDQSIGIVADGSLLAQGSGSISNSSLAGSYAINWSGVTSVNGGFTGEEDLIGATTLSSGSVSGTIDLNEFSSGFQFTAVPLTGTLALSGDGTGHNQLTVNLATPNKPNNGITAFAYIGNNNNILLMTTQSVRVAAGVLTPSAP
jgi:hypothetical protein